MRIQVKVSTCAKALRLEKHSLSGKKKQNRDFPDGPVARIVEGLGSVPSRGTKIPQAAW